MADETIALFGIGSTNLRSALGSPGAGLRGDVHVERTRIDDLIEQVHGRLETLRERAGTIDAVSIACAGLIDGGTIREIDTPDNEVVREIPLGPAIEAESSLPVRIENDCTAGALAEWVYGRGRGHDSVVHLTMGTGIGAGVVDRGHVLRGAAGQAAEVGLLPIGPEERSSSGVPGAWEAYCSGRGIAGFVADLLADDSRETALDPEGLTSRDVFEAAAAGDRVADDYLDRIGRYNAAGIGAVVNAYNPGLITVGGGVGEPNFEEIVERARPRLADYALPEVPPIRRTDLGDAIGLYGALAPHAMRSGVEATP
ncbi:ROK family protein [Saliphagus sp. LR7]|uniref:ROK family protein n=1 Tax=Saliphagus sp. LR7 TaxID=2282654 RepID=UPI000DF7910E|nr:ROK family protein [Saliphagus sp. LR7]